MNIEEIKLDSLIVKNPFVSSYWATIKKNNGWSSFAFHISDDVCDCHLLLLSKKIFGNYNIAYIPFSPVLINKKINKEKININLEEIIIQINKFINKKFIFIKIDLPFENDINFINSNKLKYCKQSVQPEATVRIDLSNSIDNIRNNYKKRAKRHLKKNENVIKIEEVEKNTNNINKWYDLYIETAKRDNFTLRSKKYIENILFTEKDVKTKLIFSYKDGVLVGGLIIIYCQELALYLYGASKKIEKYSPSYSMQDFAINLMKELNVSYYDFHGIGLRDKSSHLSSLSLFKKSFGGDEYIRKSTIDYPIKKVLYILYKFVETLRYLIYR